MKKLFMMLLALSVVLGLLLGTVGCTTVPADPTEPTEESTEPTAPIETPTEPTPTEPAVTEPPVTEPPVTEPPVTEPPVTEPPVTEPPVTEPPVTEPPVTEPPVTEPPVTEPPVTEPEVKYPTITTPLYDGMVLTNNRATLDVYAKDGDGNKLPYSKVTVTVNGNVAPINWDDHIKTSYNFVFEIGENTVVITATDGAHSTTVTYTVFCDMEAAATVTVAIEAFTVGLGYIVEPYKLTLDEATLSDMAGLYGYADAAEMKEKLSAAHCLDYTLYLHGLTMDYQGSLESTWNGFYMSSISGIADTSCIEVPEVLLEALEMNGYYVDPYVYDEGTLCEFDVTWGSGWMYMMNNSFPNVPFCDYVPQDGDVMRVQFTLAYGSDLGDWGIMGEPFFEEVDRDELTALIADAIEAGVDYTEAFEVVSTFGVTQDELDAACEALRTQLS